MNNILPENDCLISFASIDLPHAATQLSYSEIIRLEIDSLAEQKQIIETNLLRLEQIELRQVRAR